MKIWKKILSMTLCAITALSFAACGGGNNANSGVTVLEVAVHNGGVGSVWLKNAADRFTAKMADHSYANGKKGVKINITPGNGLGSASMASAAYNVYFIERVDTYSFMQSGLLMDLTEVFQTEEDGKTLESRINSEMLPALKGNDNKYYVLPGWEFYPGLSYDQETFDFCGAYFAAPGEDGLEYDSGKFGTATFVGKTNAKKSCGPDGVSGNDDDGLPSSLQEMLILCAYLKNNGVKDPIYMSSQYPGYSKYLIAGLWASLAGYDAMKTCYTFDGSEAEVVKLDDSGNLVFTDENLFSGIDYLKKPATEKVSITEANGYRTNDMAAKYYAAAFLEIIYKEGYMPFSDGKGVSHNATQLNTLLGGSGVQNSSRKGMLVEGSYWFVESDMAGNTVTYQTLTKKDVNARKIKWMPLPTSLNTTVTEGNGRKNTLIDTGMGVCYINNNIKNNEELKQASIDFVKFCYSQEELELFTETTGSMRPIDYSVDESKVNSVFYSDLLKLRKNSNIVLFSGDNNTFKYNRGALKIELGANVLSPNCDNKRYDNFLDAYNAGKNAVAVFDATRFTSAAWSTLTR